MLRWSLSHHEWPALFGHPSVSLLVNIVAEKYGDTKCDGNGKKTDNDCWNFTRSQGTCFALMIGTESLHVSVWLPVDDSPLRSPDRTSAKSKAPPCPWTWCNSVRRKRLTRQEMQLMEKRAMLFGQWHCFTAESHRELNEWQEVGISERNFTQQQGVSPCRTRESESHSERTSDWLPFHSSTQFSLTKHREQQKEQQLKSD